MTAKCLRCGAGNEWIEGKATIRGDTEIITLLDGIEKLYRLLTFPSDAKAGPFPPELELHPASFPSRLKYYESIIDEARTLCERIKEKLNEA